MGGREKQQYCLRGHEMSGDNVYEYRRGDYILRRCRECQRIRQQSYRTQNRELRRRFLKEIKTEKAFTVPQET